MTEELKDVTDSLELVPVSDLEVGFVLKAAEIEIQGKEVLEQALAAYQKKYAGYIVTEETLSDDTKVKDELGRVQRQIEQELKNQLSEYSKPLDEVKAWVDEVLTPIKTLQDDIKNQIKEFEERATEARKETVKEAFEAAIAEAKLKQRIEEMTAIAEAKGLNPEKYVDLLNEGRSALDVINILHADADELRQAQAEAERNTQNQSYAQNQPEFNPETASEGNYTPEQETGQKSQNKASGDVAKKYGYRYQNMEIIFPEKNMRQVKEQFKTISQELGIIVRIMPGAESKAEKVEMK